jgi:hypothetical protein
LPWKGYVGGLGVVLLVIAVIKLAGREPKPESSTSQGEQSKSSASRTRPGIVFPATPPVTPTVTERTDSLPLKKSQFEQRVEEYQSLLGQLRSEVAAYRQSLPVKEFCEVFEKKVTPLIIEGEQARLQAEAKYGRDRSYFSGQSEFNTAVRTILRSLFSSYGEVPNACLALHQSGKVRLDEKEERLATGTLRMVMKYDSERTNPVDSRNPFDEGTKDAMAYNVELGLEARTFSEAFSTLLFKLPPELEQKEHRVHELYDKLRQDVPAGSGWGLPEEYVDEDKDRTRVNNVLEKFRREARIKRIKDSFGGQQK